MKAIKTAQQIKKQKTKSVCVRVTLEEETAVCGCNETFIIRLALLC